MSMPTEAVEALHALTSELKAEHERRDEWIANFANDKPEESGRMIAIVVNRSEGERIFADRIAAHESRIKELGWERKIRVESSQAGGSAGAEK